MIQLLFFLRFRTQLRRTRPELIGVLENAVTGIIETAGGTVDSKHRVITGTFDENSLGIWLTIITVLETILEAIDKVSPELYGYVLVITQDTADYEIISLCSTLASRSSGTGIWCAPGIQLALSPYITIEEKISEPVEYGPDEKAVEIEAKDVIQETVVYSALIEGYARLRIMTNLEAKDKVKELFPFREKILRLICYGAHRNAVLLSPAFIGKRDGIYRFCAETLGEIPPLILRFGIRSGIGCFADLLSPTIHSLIQGHIQKELLDELDWLRVYLFQERLMEEYSGYVIQKARVFFQKLLAAYIKTVKHQKGIPILILERIHYADDTSMHLCLDILKNLPNKTDLLIYGTCSYQRDSRKTDSKDMVFVDTGLIEERLQLWKGVFPRVIKFTPEECSELQVPEMSRDLWEMAYSAGLLGRYFPGFLFSQLFEEEEKKSTVMLRAFTILSNLGLIDCIEDPAPRIPDFTALAETHLGERKDRIHQFVRNRLLAWVLSEKLRPCFSLLEILAELGGQGGDKLILEAIYGDVIHGACQGIEQAIKEKRFDTVVGAAKGHALYYIFITLKALIHGKEADIREAFKHPIPKGDFFSGYRIHMLANLTKYHLGIKSFETALETVKEAMLIGQNQKQGIAQVYRLFSLVNISKQQVKDSLDYVSFAVDNAEKSEQFDELGVVAYYAATAQFLFGNLSKAEQFALKSEQAAIASKRPGWEDRAKFLRGKLRFEIGYYRDALALFTSLRENPTGSVSEDMERVVSAWIYRAMVYAGVKTPKKPPMPGYDGFLFEIEASYMTGDYQKTIALTQRSPPDFAEADFLYTERPDWRSGFAQGELLLLSPKDLLERMIFAYRCLAFCRLPSAGQEREQVIQQMQRFTRDVLLPDRDPNDIFYFYVYYRMLLESEASEIDRNTAVSMAFRRLQRRANRIDDIETKRVFLNLHYWNSTLSVAAKDHKLI